MSSTRFRKREEALGPAMRDMETANTWPETRERHTRQRVLRLNAVANTVHSAATFARLRRRNLWPACCSLIILNTGSTICFLSSVCLFARRGGHPSAVAPQRRVVRPNGYVAACCCTDWTAGCRYSMRDASLPPKRRPQVQGRCETASRLPQVMPSGLQTPEGLSEPRETAPEPLTMVAAANGHGSVIDDADVVSMTVTTSPRRSTFLQQARWDAVQKAKLEGMSIRKMARELGLHRDTVRRYIDVESPPTRRSRATPATVPSDTIPE